MKIYYDSSEEENEEEEKKRKERENHIVYIIITERSAIIDTNIAFPVLAKMLLQLTFKGSK